MLKTSWHEVTAAQVQEATDTLREPSLSDDGLLSESASQVGPLLSESASLGSLYSIELLAFYTDLDN